MSLDASGGSMDKMTSISSGFKFLEYEIKYRSEDWRLLGDFLTEPVRYFKELMSQELVPTGYIDPNVSSPPKIPSGGSNSGDLSCFQQLFETRKTISYKSFFYMFLG